MPRTPTQVENMRRYLLTILGAIVLIVGAVASSPFASGIMETKPVVKKVKNSTVAGSWYPGEPTLLAAYLDKLLEKAASEPLPAGSAPVRALLLPHAGYKYSGATAAAGIKQVQGKSYRRVVVLGPAHRRSFVGLSMADVSHYKTPLGLIPLDLEAKAALSRLNMVNFIPGAHSHEHSIEMELPLLQRALQPGWKLVPILVGQLDQEGFAQVAEEIKFLLDAETLLVVSGDFTHYGSNYEYQPFPKDENTAQNIRDLDMGAFAKIAAHDAAGFANYRTKTGITACGFGPISLLLNLMSEESMVHLLDYKTSGQLTGDFTNSVSYMALAISAKTALYTAKVKPSAELSKQDMILLHKMARRALDLAVRDGPGVVSAEAIAVEFKIPEHFREPSGAFVTLKKTGNLRGCIGFIQPIKPLYQAVVDNAVNAALRDRRFYSVKAGELAELDIEVSVLSPMRPIASYSEFKVGHHGVFLSKQGMSSVFLPQVAVEQGWNRDQTLTHLSRKAGLSGDAWKSDTSFEVFTAQKYSAPYGGQDKVIE